MELRYRLRHASIKRLPEGTAPRDCTNASMVCSTCWAMASL